MDKSVSVKLRLGIVLLPLIFSWFTLKKGYSTLSRVISFAWLFLTVAVSASGDKQASTLVGITIIGLVFYSVGELFVFLYKKANQHKQKMLAIINDDEQWANYCIEKKLTPSAQKFVLKTYGIEKPPVELPISEPAIKVSLTGSSDEDDWKSYDTVEDWQADLTTIWSGKTDDIQFSYRKDWDGKKERKTVSPTEVVFDGNKRIYIKGFCHKRQKDVHFNTEKIETLILAGSTRYEIYHWVEQRLKVDLDELSDKHDIWI
ncbi:WYL domain-containing protein [Vibrio sp. 10N.222.49.B4]|uniref:WYL domain-containing protein n=1 Tax=Vibrio sp. 10N.222.49.B4 TaxID=3229613 RepID=UPI00354BD11A